MSSFSPTCAAVSARTCVSRCSRCAPTSCGRSLTVLGIVVGVATVIAMVSIVNGFNNNMVRQFQSFGATLVQFQKF